MEAFVAVVLALPLYFIVWELRDIRKAITKLADEGERE